MNFSFKSLSAIWSLSPQRFHYHFFFSVVSWQYQKYSTILILVLCLLCVTPLVCWSYSIFAPSSPFFNSWWQEDCELFTLHLFSNVLHRHRRVSPRRPEPSECLSHTEARNAISPGGSIVLAGIYIFIYSRRVRTILQNSRQNPKISKISKLCHSFKCDAPLKSYFCICW